MEKKLVIDVGEMIGGDREFLSRRSPPAYGGDDALQLVDLFSGCGGMTLGALEACRAVGQACEVALAVEIDDTIRSVYQANFAPRVTRDAADVRKRFDRAVGQPPSDAELATRRDLGRVHLLLGGPPCQGNSNLNNHTRQADPKNALYLRVVRAAEILRPEMVVIENVPGVRKDKQGVLEEATAALRSLGYFLDAGNVSAVDIGVAQSRVRHVVVASIHDEPSIADSVRVHHVAKPRTFAWAVRDMSASGPGLFDTAAALSLENQRRAEYLQKSGRRDLPNELRPPCHQTAHRYKSMYGRLSWDEPAQTITTGFGSPGQGRYLHPDEIRTITPHEAARVQFFPDWFDFSAANTRTKLAACIGNAVPPKLSFVLVRHLLGLRNTQRWASGSGSASCS